MATLAKVLIALAALAFLCAVFAALSSPIYSVTAEGFSRAANNLALIAIALMLMEGKSGGA